MRSLFKSVPVAPTFEKSAGITALPEDPASWAMEIHQEVYKQIPYIDAYDAEVNLTKVDGERGYAFGEVVISTKIPPEIAPESGAMAPNPSTQKVEQQSPDQARQVRVPIVVRDRKLLPLDLVIGEAGKVYPLTEDRLRQCMFRPALFDLYKSAPGDMSMVNQLFPPIRGGFGAGGSMIGTKLGSDKEAGVGQFLADGAKKVMPSFASTYKPGETAKALGNVAKKVVPLAAVGGAGYLLGRSGSKKEGSHTKEALGKMLSSLLRKQTDPARLSNIARLTMSRGAQLAAQGGEEATEMGKKYLKAGTWAAQKVANGDMLQALEDKKRGDGVDRGSEEYATSKAKTAEDNDLVHQVKTLLEAKKKGGNVALLKSVSGTITGPQLDRVATQVDEPHVKHAFLHNPALKEAAAALSSLELKKEAGESYISDVFQAVKVASDQYQIRIASSQCWNPVSYDVDRQGLVDAVGEKVAEEVDVSGAVTLSEAEDEGASDPAEEGYQHIIDSGFYKVQDTKGNELVGLCFANLIDLDGKKVPIQVFTNGSVRALQADIAGVKISDGPTIRRGSRPRGEGLFFSKSTSGEFQAMVPMTIKGVLDAGGDATIRGVDYMGRPFALKRVNSIGKVVLGADGTLLVPTSWDWLTLEDLPMVDLVAEVDSVKKASWENSLTVHGSDSFNFHFEGPAVSKLASSERTNLNHDQATFLLAGLGFDPFQAQLKLAKVAQFGGMDLTAGKPLAPQGQGALGMPPVGKEPGKKPEGEEVKMASAVVSDVLNAASELTVKLAVALPDPEAVDAVLSLGFINPDNIDVFVRLRPMIEEAESRMAELLLATRLGLQNIPEGALERALPNIAKVTSGLRTLSVSSQAHMLTGSTEGAGPVAAQVA